MPETESERNNRKIKQDNPHIDIDRIAEEVTFIMSMPRLAFTDNMYCLINACTNLRLCGKRHSGVFWEQGIENLLEDATHEGYKYALAIDYDTYFTNYHIVDLYDIMQRNPEVDILVSLQPRRGHKYPMSGTFQDDTGFHVKITSGGFVNGIADCDTAQFGLTLIKLEALKKLTKPWFNSVTNKEGTWRREHKDADIYFWIQCKRAGVNVKLAEVFVGHLELMCSWCGPAENGFTTHYEGINQLLSGGWPEWTTPKSFKKNK